jgi:hypothetical protein
VSKGEKKACQQGAPSAAAAATAAPAPPAAGALLFELGLLLVPHLQHMMALAMMNYVKQAEEAPCAKAYLGPVRCFLLASQHRGRGGVFALA